MSAMRDCVGKQGIKPFNRRSFCPAMDGFEDWVGHDNGVNHLVPQDILCPRLEKLQLRLACFFWCE